VAHQAIAAYERGAFEEVVRLCTILLDQDPQLDDDRQLRGFANCRLGRFEDAERDLARVILESHDGNAAAAYAHIFAVWKGGNRAAVVWYERAVEQGCRTAAVYNNLGHLHYLLDELPEATAALKEAIALDDGLGAAYYNLLRVELRRARKTKYVPDLAFVSRVLELQPQSPDVDLDAACLYAKSSSIADKDDRRRFTNEVFKILDRPAARSLPEARLKDILIDCPELQSDNRWQDLKSRERGNASSFPPANLMLDPLPGLKLPAGVVPETVSGR